MKTGFDNFDTAAKKPKEIITIKLRVFNFSLKKDIEDYMKLYNNNDEIISILEEQKNFDKNGVFRIATRWAETKDSGVTVFGAEVLDSI